jgi:polysaccharide export outer membrane protein
MKYTNYFILFLILFYLASCTSIKETVYFQDKQNKKSKPLANLRDSVASLHIIAVGDFVSIVINTPLQTSAQILTQKEGSSGTQVKGDSTIEIPILGNIRIAGLTMAIAKDTLLQRAKIYFIQPYVNLQLINYKVTVLGEVRAPGIKALQSENATLLDAIAASGDLTDFANRLNIKILRGDSTYYLDITDIKILKSEGFYLQSNDVVYVQPIRKKNVLANISTTLALTSFVTVLISLTTTIILLTKK